LGRNPSRGPGWYYGQLPGGSQRVVVCVSLAWRRSKHSWLAIHEALKKLWDFSRNVGAGWEATSRSGVLARGPGPTPATCGGPVYGPPSRGQASQSVPVDGGFSPPSLADVQCTFIGINSLLRQRAGKNSPGSEEGKMPGGKEFVGGGGGGDHCNKVID